MFLEEIKKACIEHAQKPACQNQFGTLSFSQLWRRAGRLAGHLWGSEAPVAVVGGKQPDMLVAFLACLLCQRAYVPIDSSFPNSRVLQYIALTGASLAIVFDTVEKCPVPAMNAAALDCVCGDDKREEYYPTRWDAQKTAYIIFTSGSSGTPKAVPITADNLQNFINWFCGLAAVVSVAGSAVFSAASYSFDLSVAPLYLCFARGTTLAEATAGQRANLTELFLCMKQSGCKMMVCTPSFMQRCLQDKAFGAELLPKLSVVFFCGEVLPVAVARELKTRFSAVRIINAYGPTEATCAVCAVELTEEHLQMEALPIGEVDKAAVDITTEWPIGKATAGGEEGEIVLRGKSVSPGYLGEAENGAGFAHDRDGRRYATGDIGRIKNGLLFFGGRADGQFKYKGYRVEPGEIEAVISRFCGGVPCVVAGVRRGGRVAWLSAAVQVNDERLVFGLRERLKEVLPEYMVPRFIVPLKEFPLTQNGKLDRKAVKEMLGNGN